MSVTPGLGSFNKDKVANTFGIQLKPKGASQRPSTSTIETKSTTTGSSNVTKNKTINDFRTDNNTKNGFLSNTNRSAISKTAQSSDKTPQKVSASQSTSALLHTTVNNERANSLTTNVNHSTTKSRDPSPMKSPATTKRSSIVQTERAVSPAPPPIKRPNTSTATPKTEAQIEHQKDQPLYRRQLSKPLDNTSSTNNITTTTTTTPMASTSSLKRQVINRFFFQVEN